MTTHTLTHSIFYNRSSLLKFPKLSLRIFWILSCILISSLLVFYVFQINEITKGGYLTKNYLKKIDALSQESKLLEINFAHTSFLGDAEEKAQSLNFERVEKIKYIEFLEGSLVTK